MSPSTAIRDPAPTAPGASALLTNHAHVLVTLERNPDLRQREIAALVGITEGGVQRILNELESCGYLDVKRIGRRNRYRVNHHLDLRHPLEAGRCVGDLLRQLAHLRARPSRPPIGAVATDAP